MKSGHHIYNYLWPLFICLVSFYKKTPYEDIWWHLQIGKNISNGIWPSPDIYSYISSNEWVVHSWLFDVCIYHIFNYLLLLINNEQYVLDLIRLVLLSIPVIFVFHVAINKTKNLLISLIIIILVCNLLWVMTPRPYLLSPILLLVFSKLFYDYNTLKRSDYFYYSFLIIMWVNIHGDYIHILLAVVLTCILSIVFKMKENTKFCILGCVLCLSSLVNPHPISLIHRIVVANSYPSLDWKSFYWWLTNSTANTFPSFLTFIVSVALVLHISIVKIKCKKYFISPDFALLLVCMIMPLVHYRFIWLYIYIFISYLNKPEMYENKISKKISLDLKEMIILIIFLYSIVTFQRVDDNNNLYKLPFDAVNYFNENIEYGNVYTPWTWSGYLTYKTNQKAQIFVDTRIEPFDLNDIQFSNEIISNPLSNIKKLMIKGTDYIIFPVNETKDGSIERLVGKEGKVKG